MLWQQRKKTTSTKNLKEGEQREGHNLSFSLSLIVVRRLTQNAETVFFKVKDEVERGVGNSSHQPPLPSSTCNPGAAKVCQLFNSTDQALNGKFQPHKLDMHSIRMSGVRGVVPGMTLTCEVIRGALRFIAISSH